MTAADSQYENRWAAILGKDLEMQVKVTEHSEGIMTCGCGRSPNGMCNGNHALTDEQWSAKLEEQLNNESD